MLSNVQKRAIIDGILITVVVAILISVAASMSAARAGWISHAKSRSVVPAPQSGAVGEPSTAEVLQRQNEILAGLEVSQSALESVATDSDTAIPRGINQLKTDFADSRKE
jgi:hypothetical protein